MTQQTFPTDMKLWSCWLILKDYVAEKHMYQANEPHLSLTKGFEVEIKGAAVCQFWVKHLGGRWWKHCFFLTRLLIKTHDMNEHLVGLRLLIITDKWLRWPSTMVAWLWQEIWVFGVTVKYMIIIIVVWGLRIINVPKQGKHYYGFYVSEALFAGQHWHLGRARCRLACLVIMCTFWPDPPSLTRLVPSRPTRAPHLILLDPFQARLQQSWWSNFYINSFDHQLCCHMDCVSVEDRSVFHVERILSSRSVNLARRDFNTLEQIGNLKIPKRL